MVYWLVGQEERFRGDVGFVKALLHIAEGARDLYSISDQSRAGWFPAGTSSSSRARRRRPSI